MQRGNATSIDASGCLWRVICGLFVLLGLVAAYLALSKSSGSLEGGGASAPASAADHHNNPGG